MLTALLHDQQCCHITSTAPTHQGWHCWNIRGVPGKTVPRYFTVRYGNGTVQYGKTIICQNTVFYRKVPFFAVKCRFFYRQVLSDVASGKKCQKLSFLNVKTEAYEARIAEDRKQGVFSHQKFEISIGFYICLRCEKR